MANVLDRLIAKDGEYFGEITKKEMDGVGELTFIYARDPDGNLIELQCWKQTPLTKK